MALNSVNSGCFVMKINEVHLVRAVLGIQLVLSVENV